MKAEVKGKAKWGLKGFAATEKELSVDKKERDIKRDIREREMQGWRQLKNNCMMEAKLTGKTNWKVG